ncbi:MAG: sulfotransferase family protein [Thermoanaerobaculum sp.]
MEEEREKVNAQRLRCLPPVSNDAELVFVVGCPRSGTSALAWALAQHSALLTDSESNFLYSLFSSGAIEKAWEVSSRVEKGFVQRFQVTRGEFYQAACLGFASLFKCAAGAKRWVDQSPENVLVADQLAVGFPKAKFVQVVRDGRAVVRSMLGSGFAEPWASDAAEACKTWAFYVDTGLAKARELGDKMITVPHRAMVLQPRRVMRAVLAFLGLAYEDGPAQFLSESRVNSSFGARTQVPLDERARARLVAAIPEGWSDELEACFVRHASWAQERYLQLERQWLGEQPSWESVISEESLALPGGTKA